MSTCPLLRLSWLLAARRRRYPLCTLLPLHETAANKIVMDAQPRELVMLTQAEQMLARATTIDEVKAIRDTAEAARGYAKKIGLSREIIVHAAAIKVHAERKLGQLLMVTELATGAPGNQYTGKNLDRSHDATGPVRLSDLGISKSDSSRAQQIARLPAPAFDRYVESCTESHQEPTTAGLLRLVVRTKSDGKMVIRIKGLTGEFEWYTPCEYLNAAIEVMGGIDLDPASSELAQKHVKAKRFYTIRDDGRKQAWAGHVFLNPPYAMPYVKQFAEKMAQAWVDREIDAGIMLVNNATDTEWFHKLLNTCAAVCLTRGRISFLEATNGEAIEKRAPTHGQAFFYFGTDVPTFARVFSKFGKILIACYIDLLGNGPGNDRGNAGRSQARPSAKRLRHSSKTRKSWRSKCFPRRPHHSQEHAEFQLFQEHEIPPNAEGNLGSVVKQVSVHGGCLCVGCEPSRGQILDGKGEWSQAGLVGRSGVLPPHVRWQDWAVGRKGGQQQMHDHYAAACRHAH